MGSWLLFCPQTARAVNPGVDRVLLIGLPCLVDTLRGRAVQSFRQFPAVATILIKLSLVGCTSTAEDHLEDLRDGSVEHEQVKHEFLLARERAVGPLLDAFDDHRFAPVRGQLVEILFSLSMRLDDTRLSDALSELPDV